MSGAIRRQNDFWPEHEGQQAHVVTHASAGPSFWSRLFGVQSETRIGSLIAAGGLIMAAKTGTMQVPNLAHFSFPPGPMELCGLGFLIWLHAKWRGATRV